MNWSISKGTDEIEALPTKIGDGVFIGPHCIIEMGVNIGDQSIIGAMSFVNKDVPPKGKWLGTQLKKKKNFNN